MAEMDVSSYPKFGQGNKLMTPAEQMQSAAAPIQLMQGITGLQTQQFDLAHKQLGALNNIIGSVAALPNPTVEDVTRGVTEAVRMGVLPANAASSALGEVAGLANNPTGIKRWLFDHMTKNASIAEQMQAGGMSAPSLVDDGQRKIPVTVQSGLQPGIGRAGGPPIANHLTPGELAAPGNYTDPNTGQTIQATQQQRLRAVGQPAKIVNGGGAQPDSPSAGLPGAPLGNEEGQKALAADLTAAAPKIANTRDLAKAVQLADSLKANATGPSAEAEQRIKEFLVTRAGLDPNASGVVARQELAKYLARYTANSPNAQRSDQAAAANYQASPNISQSLPAISELAKNAIAADRMDAAMPNAFPKDGAPADYLRHKGTFMQKQDQAAYRFDFLPADEQRKIYAERKADLTSSDPAKKAAAERFLSSLMTAHKTILRPE